MVLAIVVLAGGDGCHRAHKELSAGERSLEQEAYPEAIESFEKAMEALDRNGDPSLVARVHRGLAHALQKIDRGPEARWHVARALERYKEIGDDSGRAGCYRILARLEQRCGEFVRAAEQIRLAIPIDEALEDQAGLASDSILLANALLFRGDYRRAEQRYRAARSAFQGLADEKGEGKSLLGLGMVSLDVGDQKRAIEYFTAALEKFERIGYRLGASKAQSNLGFASLRMKKYEQALQCYFRALAIRRSLGDKNGEALLRLNIGEVYTARGSFDDAFEEISLGLKLADEVGNSRLSIIGLLYLAEIRQTGDDPASALRLYDRAEAIAVELGDFDTRWELFIRKGRVLEFMGEEDGALERYFEAIRLIEDTRSLLRLKEHKTGFMEDKMTAYRRVVDIYERSGKGEAAFAIMERARARALLDLIGLKVLLYAPAEGPLKEAMAGLDAEVAELQHSITVEEKRPVGRQNAGLPEWKERLERLKHRKEELLLDAERAALSAAGAGREPLGVSELRRSLPAGTVLLEHFVLDDRLLVALMSQKLFRITHAPIGADELKTKVEALIDLITTRAPLKEVDRLAGELGRGLIGPVSRELANAEPSRLVIVPHAFLHFLPYGALRLDGRYLAQTFELVRAPSASIFASWISHTEPDAAGVEGPAGAEAARPGLVAWNPRARLQFAVREKEAVQRLIHGAASATHEAEVKEMCQGVDLLHFAVHGVQDRANPIFSYLELAPGGGEDGFLEVHEIFDLGLDASLVVLSACETGLGRLTAGDEQLGFVEAFQVAGARRVLATLWKVNDASTAQFMERFYELRRQSSHAAALRQACGEFIRQSRKCGPDNSHPFYWAPFLLTGPN